MNYKYNKNIYLMYVITFFDSLVLAYVIERIFWAQRGMTIKMVVATEIIYAITTIILEVPSGVLADRFGRRILLIIGAFFSLAEIVIIFYAYSFLAFGLAVFVAGIKNAFTSGALEAFIYDSLKEDKKENSFEGVYGKINAIDTIGASIAALGGSILAYFVGLEINYVISIIGQAIVFILMFFIKEPPRQELDKAIENVHWKDYIIEGCKLFKDKKVIFEYCMIGCILSACYSYIDEFWQLLAININVPIYLFGVISIGYSIFSIPGNLLVDKIKNVIVYDRFFMLSPLIYAICFLLIGFIKGFWMFIPLVLLGIWKGLLEPIIKGCVHHNTDSSIRATVESFISLIEKIISIAVGLIFSLYADKNIFSGYIALGIICLAYGLKNIIYFNKVKINKKKLIKKS